MMIRMKMHTHKHAQATHDFFRGEGFLYLQSPIITASDCEGAGEMFRVTTLPSKVSYRQNEARRLVCEQNEERCLCVSKMKRGVCV